MHEAVAEWVTDCVKKVGAGTSVFDIGGRDINGTVRNLFGDNVTYLSCDLYEGPNVDLVGDVTELDVAANSFDRVVCCEVLEHAPNAKEITEAAWLIVRPGGYVIITCATTGRGPHSALDEKPIRPDEHYRNIEANEMESWLTALGAKEMTIDVEGTDLRVLVQKPSS